MLGLANVIVDAFAKRDWPSLEHEVHSLHKECLDQHSIKVLQRSKMDMHVCMKQNKESSLATQERVANESSGNGGA